MTDDGLTIGEVRRMAEEIGMTHLTDEHLQELLHATNDARERRTDRPRRTSRPPMSRPMCIA